MNNITRKFIPGPTLATGNAGGSAHAQDSNRKVLLQCSSNEVDRDGEIVMQSGINVQPYRRNPVVLWMHSQANPIARAVDIRFGSKGLEALVEFPPAGCSELSDTIYGLIRADIVRGVSIGFQPTAEEPMHVSRPKGPKRTLKCELLEISLVSIPSNRDGIVAWKYAEGSESERRKAETETLAKDRLKRLRQIEVLRLKGNQP